MIRAVAGCLIFIATVLVTQDAFAGPAEDRLAFIAFFESRFPDIPFNEYANGIYAIDQDAREQWQEIETFPPYEFTIDQGRDLWGTKFPDGKTYSDCFNGSETGVRQLYPRFDTQSGEAETLETTINRCRNTHGQTSLEYGGEEMLALSAYMSFVSIDRARLSSSKAA